MSKFDGLTRYLRGKTAGEMTLSFAEIEEMIGQPLCRSAYAWQGILAFPWDPCGRERDRRRRVPCRACRSEGGSCFICAGADIIIGFNLVPEDVGDFEICFDQDNLTPLRDERRSRVHGRLDGSGKHRFDEIGSMVKNLFMDNSNQKEGVINE